MTIPPLHWLADYFPSDATAVKGHARQKQHLDIPQSQPSIGAATRGSIPLPRGSAPSGVGIGDDGSNLLDLVTTAAKKAHNLARTVGGPLNPIAPAEDAIAYGFQKGKEAGEKVQNSQYGSALGAAGATAASAGMFALPEMAGPLGGLLKKDARFAILTAENPGGKAATAVENAARNASLEAELAQRGYKYTPVVGHYKDPSTGEVLTENSFLAHGMRELQAKSLGKQFGQNGVLTEKGYHDLAENKFYPSSGVAEAGDEAPYTQLPNGKRFALKIDWNNPQEALSPGKQFEQNAMNSLMRGPNGQAPRTPVPGDDEIARLFNTARTGTAEEKAAAHDRLAEIGAQGSTPYPPFERGNPPDEVKKRMGLVDEPAADSVATAPVRYFDHYSPRSDLTTLDPSYAGTGLAGAESKRTGRPPAMHVYAAGSKPEPQFAKLNKYSVAVRGNIYDVAADPEGLVDKVRSGGGTADDMERAIQGAGYAGYHNSQYYGDTYKLFGQNPVEPAGPKRAAMDSLAAKPARLVAAAIRDPQTGQLYRGAIHATAIESAPKGDGVWGRLSDEWDRDTPNVGFVDANGKFLTRDEAAARVGADPKRTAPVAEELIKRSPVAGTGLSNVNAPSVITQPNTGDVFDTSKLGLDVPAGVSTDRPPLKRPTRADLSSLSNVPRKMREVYTPNVEKAIRDNPEAGGWYDMTQVRDAMKDLSPTGEDDFKKLMLFMGPTSIGTQVPANLRQASMFYKLWKNGELSLDDLQNGTLDLPQGYSNRRQKSVNAGIAKILTQGNLDPYTTPKTYRYANQLAGDMWGGAALDMHVGRQVGQRGLMPQPGGLLEPDTGFPTPGYTKDNPIVSSSPSDTQYAHIEDKLVNQAQNLGLTPSQYQALGWVGGGAQTGVSDTRPLLSIFNDKLRSTAAKYGYNSPMDAFTAFAQGKTPLWAMLPAAAMGGGLLYGNDQQR